METIHGVVFSFGDLRPVLRTRDTTLTSKLTKAVVISIAWDTIIVIEELLWPTGSLGVLLGLEKALRL